MNQSNMEKKPLSEEQVEEIIEALENDEFEDDTEFTGLSGDYEKTTYIKVSCEVDGVGKVKLFYGYLNDDCTSSLPSPVYQHNLKVLDFLFTGEEE